MYNIIVFVGPSASGKSTLRKHLGFDSITTWTSREMRPSERSGIDYHFTSKIRLKEMIDENSLLEYTEYSNNYYGTSINSIQETIESKSMRSIILDINGTAKLKSLFPHSVLVIGIIAPFEDCRDNMIARQDKDINERLSHHNSEVEAILKLSDILINNRKENWDNSKILIEILKNGLLLSANPLKQVHDADKV